MSRAMGIEPDEVHEDLTEIWNGFTELSARRQAGMGCEPVARSEMSTWCDDRGITGDDKLRAIRLLSAMDDTFLKVMADRWAAERKTKTK